MRKKPPVIVTVAELLTILFKRVTVESYRCDICGCSFSAAPVSNRRRRKYGPSYIIAYRLDPGVVFRCRTCASAYVKSFRTLSAAELKQLCLRNYSSVGIRQAAISLLKRHISRSKEAD